MDKTKKRKDNIYKYIPILLIGFIMVIFLLPNLGFAKNTEDLSENNPKISETSTQESNQFSTLKENIFENINEKSVEIITTAKEELEFERKMEELKDSNEALGQKEFAMLFPETNARSYEELEEIARGMYGMDAESFNIALGWLAGDNLEGQDDYWSYLSACVPVNYFQKYGAKTLKSNYLDSGWAKATNYYSYNSYQNRALNSNEYIRKIFYLALTHLDTVPMEADGVCIENGYKTKRTISDAYYVAYDVKWSHSLPIGGNVGVAGIW